MRIRFDDHIRFHRGTLHIVVACSALACAAALLGSERFPPAAAVLAAGLATLALALGHIRLVLDPLGDLVARASAETDGDGQALIRRAAVAHDGILRAVRTGGALPSGEGRAVLTAATQATGALAEVCRRRHRLAHQVRAAAPPEAVGQLEALERRADAATDPAAREAYTRAATAMRERYVRARTIDATIERLDARVQAAVAELEGAALAVGTRAELGPSDPPAALTTACDRLRAANEDLGAECEALAEVAGT